MAPAKAVERHILCELHAKPGHRDRMKELLLDLVRVARTQDGNLAYGVFEDRDDENSFYIVDTWASEATYMAHHSSDHVAGVVEQMRPILAGDYTEHVAIRFTPA